MLGVAGWRLTQLQVLGCTEAPAVKKLPAAISDHKMSLQFDMHSDQDEGYSSFSETDAEEQDAKTHVSAAWLSHMGAAAAYQPWPPHIKGPGIPLATTPPAGHVCPAWPQAFLICQHSLLHGERLGVA